MPIDPKYLDLELDIIEAHGGGRVPQEMVKNPALAGDNIAPTFPNGIPPQVVARKKMRTRDVIGAEITQVLRGKER